MDQKLWENFELKTGDIRDLAACERAMSGVDVVSHQAALGSVPRSIENPAGAHAANVTGFFNILLAASNAGVDRVVYAASSAAYGDTECSPKVEDIIGRPMSPYGATKLINEIYADIFARQYGLTTVGLRYFNVFGPRQDPLGAYAAVIPKWITDVKYGNQIVVNGDGSTTRDFCYVENIVDANIRAASFDYPQEIGHIFNIAVGECTSLSELLFRIVTEMETQSGKIMPVDVKYADFREGDIHHSLADISKARSQLGYEPRFTLQDGLVPTVKYFLEDEIT